MTPDADTVLNISADQLTAEILPALGVSYMQGTVTLTALLMKFAAREYERGADVRARDNAEMRAVFADLAPAMTDATLRAALVAAAATRDETLAISALNAANAALRQLLIALQTHAEDAGDREVQKRIWDVLKATAGRRVVSLF
jgi:hypothetical protein